MKNDINGVYNMKMFVIGERVINKLNEVGVIDSINDRYIYVRYQDKLVKLFINAFENGYIWYENEVLRNMTKKMDKDELYDCGRFFTIKDSARKA